MRQDTAMTSVFKVWRKKMEHMRVGEDEERKTTKHSSSKLPYLWITEPEIQTSKFSEKAEACEENPVLNSRNKRNKVRNNSFRFLLTLLRVMLESVPAVIG